MYMDPCKSLILIGYSKLIYHVINQSEMLLQKPVVAITWQVYLHNQAKLVSSQKYNVLDSFWKSLHFSLRCD